MERRAYTDEREGNPINHKIINFKNKSRTTEITCYYIEQLKLCCSVGVLRGGNKILCMFIITNAEKGMVGM